MAFQLWKKPLQNNKDILLALKNRLDTSTYEEDVIETLEKMYKFCFTDVDMLYDICFVSILKSLKVTEDTILQIKILQSFSLLSTRTWVKILQNSEYRAIILEREPAFISIFIKLFNSDELLDFYILAPNIYQILTKLLKSGYLNEANKFIKRSATLKETLVFEGLIEDLLDLMHRIPISKVQMISEIIKELLTDSEKNQFYFISCDNYLQQPIDLNTINTLLLTLNPASKYFSEIQAKLYIPELILKSLDYKNYKFIYLLIYRNELNFEEFVQKNLKIGNLIADCCSNLYAFKIMELIIRSTTFEIPENNSFRINTLLCYLGLQYKNLEITDFQSIDQIIYALFTKDDYSNIQSLIDPFLYEKQINLLWVLFHTIHEISFSMQQTQIIAKLDLLRKFLVENEITVESLQDQLIATVNQILIDKSVFFEKKSYLIKEFKSPSSPEPKAPIKVSTNTKNLYDDMKNNIKGVFAKFRQPEEKDRKSFDL